MDVSEYHVDLGFIMSLRAPHRQVSNAEFSGKLQDWLVVRRIFMGRERGFYERAKACSTVCSLLLAACRLASGADLGYRVAPDWPELPAGWNFGEVASVAANMGGRILVFHRGPHPIMEFESAGKFVRSWGDGMISWSPGPSTPSYGSLPARPQCDSCGAHTVRVDPEGNIWVVDVGGHLVVKMNQK